MKGAIIFSIFFLQNLILFAQKAPNVTITGKLLNPKIPILVRLMEDEAMVEAPIEIKAYLLTDSSFLIRFYISRATPVILINQTLFCEPNDSLNVVIDGQLPFPKMTFSGSKALKCNYLVQRFELNRKNRIEEILSLDRLMNDGAKLLLYKNKLQSLFALKKSKLTDFCKKHLFSQSFKDFAYSQLHYEYLYRLSLNYSGTMDVDKNVLKSYFAELTPSLAQNEKYAQASEYSLALFSSLRSYWVRPLKDEDDSSIIERQFKYIRRNFTGLTRDILSARLLVFYFEKGDRTYKNLLNSKYSDKNFANKKYLEVLQPFYNKYNLFDLELKTYINTLIFDRRKNKNSIGSLVSSMEGQVLYLNFWASWCSPCLSELPFLNKLKEKYKDKKVSFVSISIDDSEAAWDNATSMHQLNDQYTYLMARPSQNLFKKELFLNNIPRAILIDKSGKIVDADAPLPDSPYLLQKINQLLE